MRLDDQRESKNIERGTTKGAPGLDLGQMLGGGRGGGRGGMLGMFLPTLLSRFGIVGVVIVVGAMLLFGNLSGDLGDMLPAGQAQQGSAHQPAGQLSKTDSFVAKVLATTEDSWGEIFRQQGSTYPEPTLVLFSNRVSSACGMATSATGPFYCPGDRKVYLDTSFFDELAARFGAPGDFAAAYVIAHEVGHHVQTVTGTSAKVRAAQQRARSKAEANLLSVRQELQADCYAGVWAAHNRDILDRGDFEKGVRAAEAIGDDTLQRQVQGTVVPDSFTHGSSAQRVRWLTRGFEGGTPDACDTFSIPASAL